MKLNKCHIASARDGHFFTNRVMNVWNSLPDHSVTAPTVACFTGVKCSSQEQITDETSFYTKKINKSVKTR